MGSTYSKFISNKASNNRFVRFGYFLLLKWILYLPSLLTKEYIEWLCYSDFRARLIEEYTEIVKSLMGFPTDWYSQLKV